MRGLSFWGFSKREPFKIRSHDGSGTIADVFFFYPCTIPHHKNINMIHPGTLTILKIRQAPVQEAAPWKKPGPLRYSIDGSYKAFHRR